MTIIERFAYIYVFYLEPLWSALVVVLILLGIVWLFILISNFQKGKDLLHQAIQILGKGFVAIWVWVRGVVLALVRVLWQGFAKVMQVVTDFLFKIEK